MTDAKRDSVSVTPGGGFPAARKPGAGRNGQTSPRPVTRPGNDMSLRAAARAERSLTRLGTASPGSGFSCQRLASHVHYAEIYRDRQLGYSIMWAIWGDVTPSVYVTCSPEKNVTVFRPAQVKQQNVYFVKRETAPWVALTTGPDGRRCCRALRPQRERLCSATGRHLCHLAGLSPPKPGHPGVLRRSQGTQEAALVCMLPRGLCPQPEL